MQTIRFFGDGQTIIKHLRDTLETEYIIRLSPSIDGLHEAIGEQSFATVVDLDVFTEKIETIFFYLSASQDEFLNHGVIVIMLTSDREVGIRGLEAGADDFLMKPYHTQELLARIQAVKRRTRNSGTKISIKDIEIDLDKQVVKKKRKIIHLTYTQFKILHLIASRRGGIVCRQEIIEQAWSKKRSPTLRTVDVHVLRLRKKLGDTFETPKYIRTIHKHGYQFIVD